MSEEAEVVDDTGVAEGEESDHVSLADATDADSGGADRSVATQLVQLALERYSFGVTPDGRTYAVPALRDHVVTMMSESRADLRYELADAYFDQNGKVANSSAVSDAVAVLEGKARRRPVRDVHLRTAEHEGAVYVDIGGQSSQVVRISPDGWSIINSAVPVLFWRTRLTAEFPLPESGGHVGELWDILNFDEQDRVLILGFMVSALIQPNSPHPILAMFAEQGSGKSSAARVLVDLTDPSPVPVRHVPRESDWPITAAGSWVVAVDNVSSISDWFSDALCRASTGEGSAKRTLYTDSSLTVFAFRRCIILTGIDVGSLKGDLAERLLGVTLRPIDPTRRRSEKEVTAAWHAMYPRVFGALLDLCSAVMALLPDIDLDASPRMADFVPVLAAIDKILGTTGLDLYLQRIETAAEDSLSGNAFITMLRDVVTEEFEGTARELLDEVNANLDPMARRPRGYPDSPKKVTAILTRSAPDLRKCGWEVADDDAKNHAKVKRWTLTPPPDSE